MTKVTVLRSLLGRKICIMVPGTNGAIDIHTHLWPGHIECVIKDVSDDLIQAEDDRGLKQYYFSLAHIRSITDEARVFGA